MSNKQALITKLLDALPGAVDALAKESTGGNPQASKILLDHGMMFHTMENKTTPKEQAEHIVNLALSGTISTNEATKLMALLEKRTNIVELSDIQDRLDELENPNAS